LLAPPPPDFEETEFFRDALGGAASFASFASRRPAASSAFSAASFAELSADCFLLILSSRALSPPGGFSALELAPVGGGEWRPFGVRPPDFGDIRPDFGVCRPDPGLDPPPHMLPGVALGACAGKSSAIGDPASDIEFRPLGRSGGAPPTRFGGVSPPTKRPAPASRGESAVLGSLEALFSALRGEICARGDEGFDGGQRPASSDDRSRCTVLLFRFPSTSHDGEGCAGMCSANPWAVGPLTAPPGGWRGRTKSSSSSVATFSIPPVSFGKGIPLLHSPREFRPGGGAQSARSCETRKDPRTAVRRLVHLA